MANPLPASPNGSHPALRTRILVADDEENIVNVLRETLEMEGYDVITAFDGVEALKQVETTPPDLVLLDVQMPKMNGFDVCRRIKADVLLRHIPVVILTAQSGTLQKVTGLNCGADDYVTKPFDTDELLARIRTILRRTQLGLEANPLTRLPGNVSIEKEILNRIAVHAPFAVLYVDLNSFKAYNDTYGFIKGDDVIRETARVIMAVKGPQDFVGHVGGDDFVVITVPDRWETLCQAIVSGFDARSPQFYSPQDQKNGYIVTRDRKGQSTQFPLLSVAIGVVTNQWRRISSLGEVSTIGAEMKHFAKERKEKGSSYAIDRRKE